jgi:GTP cyclohydrolase II
MMQNTRPKLAPTIVERLSRARGDLRMGVPVVMTGDGRAMLVVAVEALEPARLAALRALGPARTGVDCAACRNAQDPRL